MTRVSLIHGLTHLHYIKVKRFNWQQKVAKVQKEIKRLKRQCEKYCNLLDHLARAGSSIEITQPTEDSLVASRT